MLLGFVVVVVVILYFHPLLLVLSGMGLSNNIGCSKKCLLIQIIIGMSFYRRNKHAN